MIGFPIQYGDVLSEQDALTNYEELVIASKLIGAGVLIGAIIYPRSAGAADLITRTNTTGAAESAQRVANAVSCGAVVAACNKVNDPKTKITLIACGIAIGWCGKYIIIGK